MGWIEVDWVLGLDKKRDETEILRTLYMPTSPRHISVYRW